MASILLRRCVSTTTSSGSSGLLRSACATFSPRLPFFPLASSRAFSSAASDKPSAFLRQGDKEGYDSSSSSSSNFNSRLFYLLFGGASSLGFVALQQSNPSAQDGNEKPKLKAGDVVEGLPSYSMKQVAEHGLKPRSTSDKPAEGGDNEEEEEDEHRVWVTYRNGVYDITEFIDSHPGTRSKIILAAGARIDPYWAHYRQHMTEAVLELLELMRIGNVAEEDRLTEEQFRALDPYLMEPIRPGDRDPRLVVRASKPFNAETPAEVLAHLFFGEQLDAEPNAVIPNPLFYVRNHLPVPRVDPSTYALELVIEGENGEPVKTVRFTYDELRTLFPKHEVTVTIQCAGNRRDDIHHYHHVHGLGWGVGGIGTAKWAGAKLVDILKYAGVTDEDIQRAELKHAQFDGLDRDFQQSYGASIPIDKAVDPKGDVILAYEMNGEELPPDHGFPIRAVCPGIVGARNVKWLAKVRLSKIEHQSQWQQLDYKGFSPNTDWTNVDWKSAPAIQELPVQSAIVSPQHNTNVFLQKGQITVPPTEDGKEQPTTFLSVAGYAWSGGGRGIVRVDVSADGGKTWHTANLHAVDQQQDLNRRWAWTLWKAQIPIPEELAKKGERVEIVCKAVDSAYNTQPERVDAIWNLRGLLNNSWHRVSVVPIAGEDGKPQANTSSTKN